MDPITGQDDRMQIEIKRSPSSPRLQTKISLCVNFNRKRKQPLLYSPLPQSLFLTQQSVNLV